MAFKKNLKKIVILIVLLCLMIPLFLVFLRYQNYLDPKFNKFISLCENMETGISKAQVRKKMKDSYFISEKETQLTYGVDLKRAGYMCYLYFSNDKKLIDSEFSPD